FLVADAITRAGEDGRPPPDLLYTDEDKIDEHGRRSDPHFKPDFNRELLWGQHYMSHLMTVRRDVIERVGGFQEGYEGSQDYDLVLRCVAETTPDRIVHIPHVGYHWRAIEGSTALATDAKRYPADAAKRALADHLPPGWTVADAAAPTAYTALPPRPDPAPPVSIIIPTRNGLDLVERCVASIEAKTIYPAYEIVLIDNQTDQPEQRAAFEQMAADGRLRLLDYDDEFNYSAINNFGVGQTDAPLVCLLNNDIEVIEPGWLDAMVRHAVRPDVGAVGAMLLYGDDTIQHAGVVLGLGGVAGHSHKQFPGDAFGYFSRLTIAHQVGAVTAACLVVRRLVYEEVGGLDADELAVAFNDIDLCLRIHHAGYRNIWTPEARLYHHESVSRGAEDTPEKQARFEAEVHVMLDRWGDELLHDPAYNPNLALDADSFTLARSPRVQPPWPRSGRSTNTLGRARVQE
ncbi:MAG: glycosyltransferase, partial [Acidimicrobiales bacterium]|nr:glycosyltransferase [Acidimicrobiales bacterium]